MERFLKRICQSKSWCDAKVITTFLSSDTSEALKSIKLNDLETYEIGQAPFWRSSSQPPSSFFLSLNSSPKLHSQQWSGSEPILICGQFISRRSLCFWSFVYNSLLTEWEKFDMNRKNCVMGCVSPCRVYIYSMIFLKWHER